MTEKYLVATLAVVTTLGQTFSLAGPVLAAGAAKSPVKAQAAQPAQTMPVDGADFVGSFKPVGASVSDAAQLDHVKLISTNSDLANNADISSIHAYIVNTIAAAIAYFNGIKRSKAIGLSMQCDLMPGNKALYQLQIRPLERQDPKIGVGLTAALERVKVPTLTGPISLQILMKVWYPKPEAAALLKRGLDLQKADRPADAVQLYSQAIAIDPRYSELYYCRGLSNNALKQYDKAAADFTKAIDSGDSAGYVNRAYSYRHLNLPDQAMADCNKAIELSPNDPDAYVSRAELLLDQAKYDDAIKDCDKVLTTTTTNGYARLIRGECYEAQKRYDEAERDLSLAVEILATSGEAYYFRAQAYKFLSRDQEAASDEKRARELGYMPKP